MAQYEKKSEGEGKYAAPSRGLYLRACQGASVFLVTVLALVGASQTHRLRLRKAGAGPLPRLLRQSPVERGMDAGF